MTFPHRSLTRMRARACEESGIAMLVAMAAMLIIGVLAAGAVTLSLNTNQQSRENVLRKQALEASEAGLQVALYRYNMLAPSTTSCVGDGIATPTNGVCESSATSFGSDATYQYYTTPVIGPSTPCTGSTVSSTAGISNICITSIGTSGNQTIRTEIRAASFAAVPLFPFPGITGLNGITNYENAAITGTEASNGAIIGRNNSTINGSVELSPSGTYTPTSQGPHPTQYTLSSNIVLSPVDPGSTATTNDNTSFIASGNVTYTPSTRSLVLGNNATITFTGSTYNFCSITTQNNDTINFATGVRSEIFIDSPSDPGSGCPPGSGTLNLGNNVTWGQPSTDPTATQIYVYGPDTTSSTEVQFSNNDTFYGVLYAPTSWVALSNNAVFTGAISAQQVTVDENAKFQWASQAGTLDATTQGLFYRTAWGTCSTALSASTPTAGCS